MSAAIGMASWWWLPSSAVTAVLCADGATDKSATPTSPPRMEAGGPIPPEVLMVISHRIAPDREARSVTTFEHGFYTIKTEVILKVTAPFAMVRKTEDRDSHWAFSAGLTVTSGPVEVGLKSSGSGGETYRLRHDGLSFDADGYLSYWESQMICPGGAVVRNGLPIDEVSKLRKELTKLATRGRLASAEEVQALLSAARGRYVEHDGDK